MSFKELEVRQDIVDALKDMGITKPTQIQQKTIQMVKQGKDVIGMSKTGSGKTAAFGVPILEMISPKAGVQTLIIAPTRELVVQIAREMRKFGKNMRVSIATVYGGVAIDPQIERIAHSEVIVGTPGRLLDHLERRTLDLSKIRTFVLDEADKLVEMGFIEDIERILGHTPKQKQILLFGATLSDEIEHIKKKHMHDPVTVKAETHVEEDFLKQYYYDIKSHEKFSLLVHLLRKERVKKAIIFCSSRTTVEIVAKNLRAQGIRAEMIHGKLSQNRRQKVIDDFNKSASSFLVASAVAARGLDIKFVSHIYNYDLAQDPQEYVHRIGRTARAGEHGKAITLLSEKDYDAFSDIQRRFPVNITKLPNERFRRLRFDARVERRRSGGRRGDGARPQRRSFGEQQFRAGDVAYDQERMSSWDVMD